VTSGLRPPERNIVSSRVRDDALARPQRGVCHASSPTSRDLWIRRGKSVAKDSVSLEKVAYRRWVTCDPSGSLSNLRVEIPFDLVALRVA
jgi:hypothetical protein